MLLQRMKLIAMLLIDPFYRRIIMVNKGEIFGQWDCEWSYAWDELKEPPSLTDKGFKLMLRKVVCSLTLATISSLFLHNFTTRSNGLTGTEEENVGHIWRLR